MGDSFKRGGLALIIVVMLVLAACGQGAADDTTTTTTSEAVVDTTSTSVTPSTRFERPRNRGPDDTFPPRQRNNRESTTSTTDPGTNSTNTTSTTAAGSTTSTTAAPTTSTSLDPATVSSSTTTTLGPSLGVGITAARSIGVVGCSNTEQSADGYQDLSSLNLLTQGDLGGGTIGRWGDALDEHYSLYWGLYDSRRPADGYAGVWMQLCLKSGEHNGVFTDQIAGWVDHAVQQVLARDPGVTIWISPLNFYEHFCPATGTSGTVVTGAAADWAADFLPGVVRGPDLGPLDRSQVRADLCHLNPSGKDEVGQQLVVFFDGDA